MRSDLAGLVLILASATMARAEAYPAGMTGGDVGRLVRQALAAAGQSVSGSNLYRRFVQQCLAERGYQVIGWH